MQIDKNQRNDIKENEEINKKIAQMKEFLENEMIRSEHDVAWMIERIGNINYKVLETSYLKSNHAEWIGSTVLHFAAGKDLEAFNILLDCGADFTIQNNDSLTVLHKIVDDRSNRILNEFTLTDPYICSVLAAHLKNKNFENPINNSGFSHFHIACAANNLEVVRGFINNGVPINDSVKTDSSYFAGFSPLHFAAKFCAFEVADLLLIHGANLNLKDAKGLKPLHVALETKIVIISDTHCNETVRDTNENILKLFLDKEKNKSMVTIDEWSLSFLHVSCTLKDSEIAEHFLKNNRNINSVVSMDSPLWPGYTALHFAALCNVNTVKVLMNRGADMSMKDAKGLTPFDICIDRYKPQDISVILSLHPVWKNITLSYSKTKLLDLVAATRTLDSFNEFLRRINYSVIYSLPNDSPLWPSFTAMHLAVIFAPTNDKGSEDSEQIEILRMLCRKYPRMLDSKDIHGRTPVHLAFRLNKRRVYDMLMGFLIDCPNLVDRLDEDGLSYVHIASARDRSVLLQRLLETGSNVNTVYRGKLDFPPTINAGSTALHFAVVNGCTDEASMLIKYGADVHAKDANDMTPIHLLIISESATQKMINILLSSANLRDCVVSGSGLSHLHIASWCGKTKAAERLLDSGADINGVITCQGFELLNRFAGHSSLMLALRKRDTDLLRLLVQRGADCFVKDGKGRPFLYSLVEDEDDGNWTWLFIEALKERDDVLARVEADTGMTALHVACLFGDIEDVKKNLIKGTDVNKQIRFDSPIFQGYTALHIAIHNCEIYPRTQNEIILKLLLKAGADVTLMDAASKTAVHVAHTLLIEYEDKIDKEHYYSYVYMLLQAQRAFSINPTSVEGVSHFHVACHICNIDVVRKFLNHGDIDVDRAIDCFSKDLPGDTALHLATKCLECDPGFPKQLATVDLLLKHGANAHAEDAWGDTPLHDAALFNNKSLDLFETFVRSGFDVNTRNILGDTPLDRFLYSNKGSAEGIRTLLRFGCRFNSFNNVNELGSVARICHGFSYVDVHNLILAVITNFPHEMQNDDMGRTIIHNVVSKQTTLSDVGQYAGLIEEISSTGCDVDDQDNFGRTALHVAAKFFNFKAVSALLMVGADINITDVNGKAAFSCDFALCERSDEGSDERTSSKCRHLETFDRLADHVKKLQLCGLDVNIENADFASRAFQKLKDKPTLADKFFEELEMAKQMEIEPHSLTIHDFLSETGAVVDYPRMLLVKREDVMEFFSKVKFFREEFPHLAGIIQLQFRKVRARPELVESAKIALTVLSGFHLPEVCSEFILVLLKNSELKNLIASAI